MNGASALYVGPVTHLRVKPKAHALRYRVFMLLLDLDDLPGVYKAVKRLRPGRFGLVSFRAEDHGDPGSAVPLVDQVRGKVAAAGIDASGPVRLLCMPRILGYGFNPLSVYFCHDAQGRASAILYEVRNTFGQRHSYLVAIPEGGAEAGIVRQSVPKRFYVSPFMDMDLKYDFTITPPGERVGVVITVSDAGGVVLTAAFHGERRPLSDASLLQAWATHPLLTFKVMFGIHWEAVKIFAKGIGFRTKPPLPPEAVTMGTSRGR